jgi:hypothetical protein
VKAQLRRAQLILRASSRHHPRTRVIQYSRDVSD